MVTTRAQRQKLEADAQAARKKTVVTSPEPTSGTAPGNFNMFTPKMNRILTPAAKKTLSKVKTKASESSFQIGSCCFGLAVCLLCGYLTMSMQGDNKYLVGGVCFAALVDMIVSILYYMDQAPAASVMFTEAATNACQLFLFLLQVGATENGIVLFVSGASVIIFAIQIKMKNNEKWWSRFAVYAPLFFNFALNWNSLETNVRLRVFATLVDVALVLDIFDLPDSLSEVLLCDGLLVMVRSLAVYFLVSHSILRANGATYFGFEQKIFRGLPPAQTSSQQSQPQQTTTATNSSGN